MQDKNRDISVLKERILQYLDFKGETRSSFYKKTDISNGILSQNNGLSEDNLLRFLNFYRDINKEWLLTGEGSILINEEETIIKKEQISSSPDLLQIIREKDEQIMKLAEENWKLKADIAALKKDKKPTFYGNVAEP